jgi:transcriptional regulator with XRE-family HTH domain
MLTNVTTVRKSRGMTAATLAARAGISVPTLGKLERGELLAVRAASLVAVSEALGVSVVELFPDFAVPPAAFTESYVNPEPVR